MESRQTPRRLIGYVRIVDLYLGNDNWLNYICPLLEIKPTETVLGAFMQMCDQRETMALVVNQNGETLGLLNARRLTESLFRGAK